MQRSNHPRRHSIIRADCQQDRDDQPVALSPRWPLDHPDYIPCEPLPNHGPKWTVTYRFCYTDLELTVHAPSKELAVVEAYFRAPIWDWCTFQRLVHNIRRV